MVCYELAADLNPYNAVENIAKRMQDYTKKVWLVTLLVRSEVTQTAVHLLDAGFDSVTVSHLYA